MTFRVEFLPSKKPLIFEKISDDIGLRRLKYKISKALDLETFESRFQVLFYHREKAMNLLFGYFCGTLSEFLSQYKFGYPKKLTGVLKLNYWPLNLLNYTEKEPLPLSIIMRRLLTDCEFEKVTNIPKDFNLIELEEVLEECEKPITTLVNRLKLEELYQKVHENHPYIFEIKQAHCYIIDHTNLEKGFRLVPKKLDVFITPEMLIFDSQCPNQRFEIDIRDIEVIYNETLVFNDFIIVTNSKSWPNIIVLEFSDKNRANYFVARIIDQVYEYEMAGKNIIMENITFFLESIKRQFEMIRNSMTNKESSIPMEKSFAVFYKYQLKHPKIDIYKYNVKNIIQYDGQCMTVDALDVNNSSSVVIKTVILCDKSDCDENGAKEKRLLEKQLLLLKILKSKYIPTVLEYDINNSSIIVLDFESQSKFSITKYAEKCRKDNWLKIYNIVESLLKICIYLGLKNIIQASMSLNDFYMTKDENLKLHNLSFACMTSSRFIYDKERKIPVNTMSHPNSIVFRYFSHQTDVWNSIMISISLLSPKTRLFKNLKEAKDFYLTSNPEDIDEKLTYISNHIWLTPLRKSFSYSMASNLNVLLKNIKKFKIEINRKIDIKNGDEQINNKSITKLDEIQLMINKCKTVEKYKDLNDQIENIFERLTQVLKEVKLKHKADKTILLKTVSEIEELKSQIKERMILYKENRFKFNGKEHKTLALHKLDCMNSKIGYYSTLLK